MTAKYNKTVSNLKLLVEMREAFLVLSITGALLFFSFLHLLMETHSSTKDLIYSEHQQTIPLEEKKNPKFQLVL